MNWSWETQQCCIYACCHYHGGLSKLFINGTLQSPHGTQVYSGYIGFVCINKGANVTWGKTCRETTGCKCFITHKDTSRRRNAVPIRFLKCLLNWQLSPVVSSQKISLSHVLGTSLTVMRHLEEKKGAFWVHPTLLGWGVFYHWVILSVFLFISFPVREFLSTCYKVWNIKGNYLATDMSENIDAWWQT